MKELKLLFDKIEVIRDMAIKDCELVQFNHSSITYGDLRCILLDILHEEKWKEEKRWRDEREAEDSIYTSDL